MSRSTLRTLLTAQEGRPIPTGSGKEPRRQPRIRSRSNSCASWFGGVDAHTSLPTGRSGMCPRLVNTIPVRHNSVDVHIRPCVTCHRHG